MHIQHANPCSGCLPRASLHNTGTALRLVAATQSVRVSAAQSHVNLQPDTSAPTPPPIRLPRLSSKATTSGYATASIRNRAQQNALRPPSATDVADIADDPMTGLTGAIASAAGAGAGIAGGAPPHLHAHADGDEAMPTGTDADASHDHHHDGEEEAQEAKNSMAPKRPNGKPLSESELRLLRELQRRDAEIRQHEQAHLAAAGSHARGGASYDYQTGPDGKRYAIGGKVDIDTSAEDTPEKTIRKMRTVRRAALAPKDPSSQDRRVAAKAAQQEMKAERKRLEEQLEERQRLRETSAPSRDAASDTSTGSPAPSATGSAAPAAASIENSNRPTAAEAFRMTQANQDIPEAVEGAIRNANRIFSSLNAPASYAAPVPGASVRISLVA